MQKILDLLPKPLKGVVSPSTREYIYLIASLVSAVYGIWQASDGNWQQFGIGIIAALVSELGRSNVVKAPALTIGGGDNAQAALNAISKAASDVASKITPPKPDAK